MKTADETSRSTPSSGTSERTTEKRTQDLLREVAVHLFAQKGYDGTSVRDIVNAAGVNVSLVSYHFGGKEGLYRACIERFGEHQFKHAQTHLQPPNSREEFVEFTTRFVQAHLDNHCANLDMHRLISHEFERGSALFDELLKNIFSKTFRLLEEFFRVAASRGFVRDDLDPNLLCTMMYGAMNHMLRVEAMRKKQYKRSVENDDERRLVARHVVAIFAEGVQSTPTLRQ